MIYKNFVNSFVRQWNFTRSETLEILNSLSDQELLFKPAGEKWQPLYYQFGCIIRTQIVYTRAIVEGKMDFSWFHEEDLMKKTDFKTKKELLEQLDQVEKKWNMAIRNKRREEEFSIKWPGFNMPLPVHINALISHERLHHGQLVSYLTLAKVELPKKFKENWSL